MRFVARHLFALAMALVLLNLAIGGVVPLWAQQPQPYPSAPGGPGGMFPGPGWPQQGQPFQGQPAGPGGVFSDGFGLTPMPSGPLQPMVPQPAPGTDPRFRRQEEAAVRPLVRQCAAETAWQRAPMAPQPLPGTQPEVVRVRPLLPPESERVVQQRQGPLGQGRTQGVGSISLQDLTAATPPQQLLTPGIDPTRTTRAGQREAVAPQAQPQIQPEAEKAWRADQLQRPRDAREAPLPLPQETLSPIELAFGDLRQFGYTVFSFPISTFAPVDDVPVGPDYVLGPGDGMVVNISGMLDGLIERVVDRNGRVILPKVGPVRVWGLTFSQADRIIRDELARYFRGFTTTVTLGRLRTIRVHVVGEVCQPGSYWVSSLSTLTNALFAAGGPTRLGSLREIRLNRNGHQVGMLDLYNFLLKGDRTRDFRLESGDTIFVPTIGPVVGVEGEVKRPAIYEIREPMRVSDLILTAGGVTPRSFLKRVQVVRQQPSAERTAIDIDLTGVFTGGDKSTDLELQNGDLVRIFPSDYRIYNVVHVDGAVKYPGDYELKPEMRISQLLPRENVLPEAHVDRVEIVRRRPDLSTEIVAVDLKQAWAGQPTHDVALKPLDEVSVRSELRPVGVVTLEGEVKRPGQYTIVRGERLSSVIRRAGGFTDRAYLRGAVFTRASLKVVEQEQLNTFVKVQEQKLLASAGTAVVGGDREQGAVDQQVFQARRALLRTLASRVALGRMVVHLNQPEKLENTGDDVILEDGDALRVSEQPSSVLVVGSVRTSTSVQYKEGMGMDYYAGRVGGFTKEADQKEVHIVKADGSAVSGFANLRSVEPGDTIIVPPKEEEKIRVLSTFRDAMTIFGQSLISITSLVALAALF